MQSAPTDKLLNPPRCGGKSQGMPGFRSAERGSREFLFNVGSELARALTYRASKLADLRKTKFPGAALRRDGLSESRHKAAPTVYLQRPGAVYRRIRLASGRSVRARRTARQSTVFKR